MANVLEPIHEVDTFVTLFEQLATSSRSNPLRLLSAVVLASTRARRHNLSNQGEDFDESIFYLTEAILLPPRSWVEHGPLVLRAFFTLAKALVRRSKMFNQLEDASYATKYLRHLRDQPHAAFVFPRHQVTACLVDVLAFQVELDASNVVQCIEEMSALSHELLTLDPSDSNTTLSVSLFSTAVTSKISLWVPDQPLNQVIECLRLAKKHKLDLPEASYALAWSLGCRYCTTFVDDDYEEAVSVFVQDEFVANVQQIVTALAVIRSMAHGAPEYWEEAIYRARTFTGPSFDKDRFAEITAEQRVRYFGSIEGLEASSSNSSLSRPVPVVSFEKHDDDPEIDPTFEKLELLDELLSKIRNNDTTEIDGAIEKGRTVLAPAPRNLLTSGLFDLFGLILFEAFRRTNKIECLNESINHSPSSIQAAVNTLPALHDTSSALPVFAHPLQLQHNTFAKTFGVSHRMPLDYASYQVDLHRLEEAIETLERGRGLLWSEMRHLRASIDQLLQADPQLGHEFAVINRDLEELTKSISPSHKLSIDGGGADDLRAVDSFGRLLLKQRGLLKERDNLMSRIQTLSGFDSFLTSPSFDTLCSAASSGPVLIINHSIWRSDILILLHNTSPSLIPTPHNFYDCANALKDRLLDSRNKYGLDSSHYDEALASVLAELYKLVGEPVIDRLRQLQVPEQSRIWWCPTSVFCSLPLHAMGPIPSDDGKKHYFLDLYICSYTPTLSALVQSRNGNSGSRSLDQPSILLVAQPDPSLPTVGGEIQVVQALGTKVTSLVSEAATPAAVVDGFHRHRFVHFACHGTLEAGKPFDAGFELYGERLTLLEIVRSHLPTAEFAFLSACHTAEVTEGSVTDEGLHLAAAVQYCGFRSVVGTMWAMVDADGRDLAEHFYKALFSTSRREQGVPYHERSAKALRFAVRKLRRKRWITLERWVNFVHYGA
ncbi:CHAT domain-containing protein [Lactarius pseudohatsudake]|nr:CHAT domain-containing protein [Lactarius pseudohatsudake]